MKIIFSNLVITAPCALAMVLSSCVTVETPIRQVPAAGNTYTQTAPLPAMAQGEAAAPAEYQPIPGENLVPYTVRPGDTIWRIAREQGSSIYRIKGANNLTSDLIRPGQVLQVPTMNPAAAPVQSQQNSGSFSPDFEALPPQPTAPAEVPAARPSATNPVIQGNQVPESSLGRGARPQIRQPIPVPSDFPILPPLPEPVGQ